MFFKAKKTLLVLAIIVVVAILYLVYSSRGPEFKVPEISAGENPDYLSFDQGDLTIYASGLSGSRVIAFDDNGRILVSETKEGVVKSLFDEDSDGVIDEEFVVLSDLTLPHGLAFYNDGEQTYLYVAQEEEVVRYFYDLETGTADVTTEENIANIPVGGRHFSRTILFGPNYRTEPILSGDGLSGLGDLTLSSEKLYISVGSSCDACIEEDWKYSSILESDPNGTFTAQFAQGLRNAVFMALHPVTGELWVTEMGRDGLGDDLPPDEINIIRTDGNYGWPECYGDNVLDEEFHVDDHEHVRAHCQEPLEIPSHIDIAAHSAPLGLAFITHPSWPSEWQNDLLVAYHGSHDRSEPVGYKVVRFDLDDEGNLVSGPHDFITGWLSEDGDEILGRPVDLKFGPDGTLYISDDAAGFIYRVVPSAPSV